MGGRPNFDEQRRTIAQLLEDHHHIYQGGESFPDFAEKGPATGEGPPFNAAYVRRRFQGHPELEEVEPRPMMELEAKSHVKLEEVLAELRRLAPLLAGAVDDAHFRSTAGQRDMAAVRELAKSGEDRAEKRLRDARAAAERTVAEAEDAAKKRGERFVAGERRRAEARAAEDLRRAEEAAEEIRRLAADARSFELRYDWALDALAARLLNEELFATSAKRRGRLEEKAMERQHGQIYAELLDRRERFPKKRDSEHKKELAALYNVSVRTIERVIEAREKRVG